MIATKPLTAADLDLLDFDIQDYEILDGMVWERKTLGRIDGRVGFRLGIRIGPFVELHRLGELYTSDTNLIITTDPLSVLRPDIAFVRTERLPPDDAESGYYAMVPDFVVEVLSPSNRQTYMMAKIERYFGVGVRLIWIVDPRSRTVSVYVPGQDPQTYGEDDDLDGGDVIPGFRVSNRDIFR